MSLSKKIKIIGIGQSFRGDDAIGVEVVDGFRKLFVDLIEKNNICVEINNLPGLELINLVVGFDSVIFVDAVQTGLKPVGTIYKLKEKQLASFVSGAKSAHGMGVAESLALGRKLQPDEMPQSIRILGIEANQFEMGEGISLAIDEKIPEILEVLKEMVVQELEKLT